MKREVVQYLLLQKDEIKNDRAEKYIKMAENHEGHTCIRDAYDRAIATIFELVIDEELNPWEIDLVSFSKMYLKRIKVSKRLDLLTAGRIILMAWKVLRLQSDYLIVNLEGSKEEDTWEEIPDWYGDDASYFYTKAVMENDIPLEEKVRRKGKRKVTLLELINAFEEARGEIETREKMREIREKDRKNNIKRAQRDIGEHTHQENVEEEIQLIMEKISRLNGRAIPFHQLCNKKDKSEIIMTLSSILFLANEKKIRIWQDDFPFGEIYIKSLHHE
jgi:segregation and condensation protein A